MRIVCQQTIFMEWHAFFVIFEKKTATFEIFVCWKLQMALNGLITENLYLSLDKNYGVAPWIYMYTDLGLRWTLVFECFLLFTQWLICECKNDQHNEYLRYHGG